MPDVISAVAPVDAIFSALGDPVRLSIIEILGASAHDRMTVSDLALHFPISLQAVSKHIKVLEAAGVVTQIRDGRHRPVTLVPSTVSAASNWLDDRRLQIEARYDRLDHLLADLNEGHH